MTSTKAGFRVSGLGFGVWGLGVFWGGLWGHASVSVVHSEMLDSRGYRDVGALQVC